MARPPLLTMLPQAPVDPGRQEPAMTDQPIPRSVLPIPDTARTGLIT